MNTIIDILLRSTEIITIVSGLTGLSLSLALLFSRDTVRRVSDVLNRQFRLGLPARDMNREVSLDTIIGWFPTFSGALIAAASLAILIYLFLSPVPAYAGNVVMAIALESMRWLARVSALSGLVFGLLLVFSPETIRRVNRTLNRWHDTDRVIQNMEDHVVNFDGLVLDNPRVSGIIGSTLSTILLILVFTQ